MKIEIFLWASYLCNTGNQLHRADNPGEIHNQKG